MITLYILLLVLLGSEPYILLPLLVLPVLLALRYAPAKLLVANALLSLMLPVIRTMIADGQLPGSLLWVLMLGQIIEVLCYGLLTYIVVLNCISKVKPSNSIMSLVTERFSHKPG